MPARRLLQRPFHHGRLVIPLQAPARERQRSDGTFSIAALPIMVKSMMGQVQLLAMRASSCAAVVDDWRPPRRASILEA